MKNTILKRILPILLTLVMLFSAALPVLGASVSAPNEEEPCYEIVFEDGVLTLRLDPDKVYEVIKDGELTREELKMFIPEEILNTVTDGTELTLEDLAHLAAEYVSVDDLIAIKNMIPAEIFFEYFDLEMLEDVITLDELLSVISIDDILAGVTDDDILALVNDEAFKILLNERAKNEVLTDDFIKSILQADGNEAKINALVETKHDELMDLVTNEVVNKLLDDPAYDDEEAALFALIDNETTLNRILADPDAVTAIKNYIMTHDLYDLEHDEGAINRLKNSQVIRDFIATHVIVHDIVDGLDVDLSGFAADFGITENFLTTGTNADDIGLTVGNVSPYVNITAAQIFDDGLIDTSAISTVFPQITVDSLRDNADALGITVDEAQNLHTVEDLIAAVDDYSVLCNIYSITADSLKNNANALGITISELVPYVNIPLMVKELISNDKLDLEKLCELRSITVEALLDKGYLSNADVAHIISDNWTTALNEGLASEIVHCIGMHSLLEDFGRDGIVNSIGGYKGIITKGYVIESEVLEAIGGYQTIIDIFLTYFPEKVEALIDIIGYENWKDFIDLDDIIDRAGGYDVLVTWYSMTELGKAAKAIGVSSILDFVNDTGIRDNIDFEGILRDLINIIRSKKPELKVFAKRMANSITQIMTNEVSAIYLNRTDENVNRIYKNGEFDLQEIVTTVLQAIPDVDHFTAMSSGDVFTQLIFTTNIRGKDIRFGFAIELIGDLSRLQDYARRHADYFVFDVTENMDITAEVVIPAVASELYERALLSTRVPARLKIKVLEAPTMTLEDAKVLLEGLTDEELESYASEVLEKMDDIKAKVYAKIEAKLGTDNEKIEAAKAKVDEILDKFSDGEKLGKLRDKGVSAISKLSDRAGDITVADLYDGQGVFSFDRSFSVDLYALISKVVTLPDDILVVFGNDMTLKGSIDAKLTVNGLYRATVIDKDGTSHEYFLPQGIPMTVLNDYASVDYVFTNEKMPSADATYVHEIWYVINFYREDGTILETINYKEGESVTAPKVPEKVGFTAAWESYTLESDKVIDVHPVYTAIDHKPGYTFNGQTVKIDIDVSATDKEVDAGAFPTKEQVKVGGYNLTGWLVDYNLNGVEDEGDFLLEYDAATNTYRVPNGYSFPVVDVNNGEYIHFLPSYTAIQYKAGYKIGENSYTLRETVTVNTKSVSLPVLTETGYTFDGWYVDVNSNGVIDGEDFKLEPPATTMRMMRSIVIGNEQTYSVPEGKSFPALDEGEEISLLFKFSVITYTATFTADGTTVKEITFDVEDTALTGIPQVPAKDGFTGEWYVELGENDLPLSSYTLGASDITVYAKYTAIPTYKATFTADGATVKEIIFRQGATSLTGVPEVPAKDGFTGEWYVELGENDLPFSSYTITNADFTVYAKYTAIPTYKATFTADGATVKEIIFRQGATSITGIPEVPAKAGYTGEWYVELGENDLPLSSYTITNADFTVYAKYTPKTNKVQFVVDGQIIDTVEFKTGDTALSRVPTATPKTGYTVAWEDYTLGTESLITVRAIYTPIKYKATFVADGSTVKEIEFTIENTSLTGVPEVPAKLGYTGKWADYTLGAQNVTIEAKYELVIFKAQFVVDGQVIATVDFTVNDTTITEPAVPTKDGYVGKWEAYELGASDIVINAVYTEEDATETLPPIVIEPGDDDGSSPILWWILLAIIIILIIIWILSKTKDDEPEEAPKEPVKEAPVVEEAPAVEEAPVAEPIEKVEEVDVETADKLMSDATAASVMETVRGGVSSGLKAIINVSDINAAFAEGDVVDLEALKAKKLVPVSACRLKVLADGTLNKAITVYAEQFSVQAVKMITLTGGKAIKKL